MSLFLTNTLKPRMETPTADVHADRQLQQNPNNDEDHSPPQSKSQRLL